MVGKHCKSEVLCELLSVTGSCSSICPRMLGNFMLLLLRLPPTRTLYLGLPVASLAPKSSWDTAWSKEPPFQHAVWDMCCSPLGRYIKIQPSSHGPVGLPPQSYPCSAPSSHGHTEFRGWHKHLGKTLGKEKFK